MTKKNVIPQDPIGDGVGARKLKVRFSLSRTGHVDWVILILCPFLEIRSFSNFARHLRPMSEELCREWPFIVVLCGMPIDP